MLSALIAVLVGRGTTEAAERIVLDRVVVISPDAPASFVAYGVAELIGVLRAHGCDCRIGQASEFTDDGVVLLVGSKLAGAHGFALDTALGDEGFVVQMRRDGGRVLVSAAGRGPAGTKFALIELIKALRADGARPYWTTPLPRRAAPRFGLRGMYAHLHWQYAHPYALRSWSEDDWKRYIDLLSYFGCNVLQCWPMAAICPAPFSDADRAYLEKYKRVIEYAHRCRGMQVWPGESPNNVALSDGGVPIEQRSYFDVEVKLDPSKPDDFAKIIASRKAFYETVPNGDAYWILDSDPGGWKGSPTREFVDILCANRKLLDAVAGGGKPAGLIYWMWQGWGTAPTREANLRATLEQVTERLGEPWWLHACDGGHLKIANELGLGRKVTYFPYNHVEHEPSWPITRLACGELREVLRVVEPYRETRGVLGNAQTPIVQLPNIYFFTAALWDWSRLDMSEEAVLRELAGLLLPEHVDALVHGWQALGDDDPQHVHDALEAVRQLAAADDVGRAGACARFIVPDVGQVPRDLAMMLAMHGRAREFVAAMKADGLSPKVFEQRLGAFLDAGLAWFAHTGFERPVVFHPDCYGVDFWAVRAAIDEVIARDAAYKRVVHETLHRLFPVMAAKYSGRLVHEVFWRMAGEYYPALLDEPETGIKALPASPQAGKVVSLPIRGTSVAMELSFVPGGEFDMTQKRHVTLSPYWIGRYEVTNEQYRMYVRSHHVPPVGDLLFDVPEQPAVYVSWRDAVGYCDWLSERTGHPFRLPTEAEWAFACGRLSSDAASTCAVGNMADRSVAAFAPDWSVADCDDGFAATAPVGRFAPNALHVYDMLGNAAEWCRDWYSKELPVGAVENPTGPGLGSGMVIRGGSWSDPPSRCTCTARGNAGINDRQQRIGFRVVLVP